MRKFRGKRYLVKFRLKIPNAITTQLFLKAVVKSNYSSCKHMYIYYIAHIFSISVQGNLIYFDRVMFIQFFLTFWYGHEIFPRSCILFHCQCP